MNLIDNLLKIIQTIKQKLKTTKTQGGGREAPAPMGRRRRRRFVVFSFCLIFGMIFNDFSMIFIDFQCFPMIFQWMVKT